MPKPWLTENAILLCSHQLGVVSNTTTQNFVTIRHKRVLIENNPVNRPIGGCPNTGPTIKPCTSTINVKSGYCSFIRINGRRICLSSISGYTDGTPPGNTYKVSNPGQFLVRG